MEELLNLYSGLIKKIASYYYYHLKVTHMDLDELITEGQMGFINAVRNFDISKGYQLSTYVTYGIKNSILNALRETSMIKYSTRELMKQVNKNKKNIDEKTQLFDLNLIGTAENLELCMCYANSIDALSIEENNVENTYFNHIEKEHKHEIVQQLLQQLLPNEKKVIIDYFGIGSQKRLTLKAISKKYDIPYTKVRQIKEESIEKIKKYITDCNNNELEYLE
ncbi:MAG TPA: hypothetical protein DDX02_02235 [Clostridiaceae bacterium]|jgi:RNA polymerase primary sigma factor|nr:hypothetical protein [Clostridiaceae bacterium]